MQTWLFPRLPRLPVLAVLCGIAAGVCVVADGPAQAQVLVVSVNGDPITSVDIEQRMKLLRSIHRPASRDAAIESMVETRLKYRESLKFGVNIGDNDIGEQVQTDAKKLKTSPQALLTAMTGAGVSQEHLRNYFRAELGYRLLTKALNRGVEASEIAVREELAKEKGKSTLTKYSLRQVVFTLTPSATPAIVEASVKQAEALRGRFTNCATGIPYAKTLPGVAVREPLKRSSTQLPDGIKDVLEKTPIGHLTPPSRSANGIELVAVCERSASQDDDELRKTIADRLLAEHIDQDEMSKYKELRSHAVITRAR